MTPTLADQARSFGQGDDLAAFIESARERAAAPSEPRCTHLIAGKDESEWLPVIEAALQDDGYRANSIREAALADLKDPAVDPRLRAVLAKALRPRVDERRHFLKVRAETAAPEVVAALDANLERAEQSA